MSGLALVCLGGALGSGARYLVGLAALRWLGPDAPAGTLLVNFAGAFLIGVLQQAAGFGALAEPARLALVVGVMGGFTTYSAFSYETVRLVELGLWPRAALYVVLTTAGCLALTALGMVAVRAAARG